MLFTAKQKTAFCTVGSKIQITTGDNTAVRIIKTEKGYLYVINNKTNNRVISEKSKRELKNLSF
jgi:hypothetical protein